MSAPAHLLQDAFKDALARAAELDKLGIPPGDTTELFPGHAPTNVELVQASLKEYKKNQAAMDRAVQDVIDFLDTPDGAAYVKALEGSLENPVPNNALSVDIAQEILRNGEFGLASSHPQGLRGFGIGVSAGVSAVVGLLAGADVVFDFKDEATVHGRVWKGASLKGGLSVSAGLELSFWVQKPVTGAIAGWLLDLYIPTKSILLLFVRFMYIKQRPEGMKELDFGGVSLQFPLGIGLPIRHDKGTNGVIALFGASQTAYDRPRRATLTVVNKATGLGTIAVQETATLEVTLTNTSNNDVNLNSGATMTITMPSYFTPADISAMKIDFPGWSFTDVDGSLTLTLSKNTTWATGTDLFLNITNVKSSNQPPYGQQSTPGKVKVSVDDVSFDTKILTTADFSLVWSTSMATLQWDTKIAKPFTLTGPANGTVTAYAQPGNYITQLTTAIDGDGVPWTLGFVFNYNTAIADKVIPQVTACWWKTDAPKAGKNVYYGNAVDQSGQSSVCWYGGTSQSGSEIIVTPTFG